MRTVPSLTRLELLSVMLGSRYLVRNCAIGRDTRLFTGPMSRRARQAAQTEHPVFGSSTSPPGSTTRAWRTSRPDLDSRDAARADQRPRQLDLAEVLHAVGEADHAQRAHR